MAFRAGLFCGVTLGAVLAGASGALPDDFTVKSGETVTSTQELTGLGGKGLIETGGAIIVLGESGVHMWGGDNQRVTNRGTISTEGDNVFGIYSEGPNPGPEWVNAQIKNVGEIVTKGFGAYGIHSEGGGASIENSGNISTEGIIAFGMYAEGASVQIYNSGDITTSGAGGYAIWSRGPDARIVNSGFIETVGSGSFGIAAAGDNVHITNSGVIRSRNSSAIRSDDPGTTVTNTGKILASGYAIMIAQEDATLNLLAGSVIQGGIYFGRPLTSALNIGPGLNTALTLDSLPSSIRAHDAHMVVQGSLVAVVDPTGFAAQDEMLTDLTRAIGGAIDGRLNAARFGYTPVSAPVTAYVEPATEDAQFGYGTGGATGDGGSGLWAAGIGSYRDQKADDIDGDFDSSLGGIVIGYDTEVAAGTRVGGFVGASASRFRTDANSQEIDADSYFGGLYAGFTGATYFLDLAVTGGVTQQSSDRTVANNLVEGGIEHAKADYDGVFVSPSVTLGTKYAMANGGTFIPSVRARYAGLFLQGYDESGSAADLSVDDRDVNVFDLRAQLAYALAVRPLNTGSLHTTFRIGADGTFSDNSDVEAVLVGNGLNFSVSDDDTVRGFAGVDMVFRTNGGSSFFLGAEAGYDNGDAFTLDVRGGLRMPLR